MPATDTSKTATAAERPFGTQAVVQRAGKPLAKRPGRNILPEQKDREIDGLKPQSDPDDHRAPAAVQRDSRFRCGPPKLWALTSAVRWSPSATRWTSNDWRR